MSFFISRLSVATNWKIAVRLMTFASHILFFPNTRYTTISYDWDKWRSTNFKPYQQHQTLIFSWSTSEQFSFLQFQKKKKIRRPMSNSYLMFSDITGYKTILYETKASIYEKAIEAILDSINGIIIIIGHIIMISIGYFLTNNDLKDTLGYIKIWHFLTKSHFLQVTTAWRITNLKSFLRRTYQIFRK